MGFKINSTWFKADDLLDKLLEAETKGLKKIQIEHKSLFSASSYKGQILHDYDEDESKIKLKSVWRLVRSWHEKVEDDGAEYTTNLNSTSYGEFELVENNYADKLSTTLTITDMHNIMHEKSKGLLKAGKYGIDPDGYYCFVKEIFIKTNENYALMRDSKLNPHGFKVTTDDVYITYNYEGKYEGRMKDGILPKEDTDQIDTFLKKFAIIEEDTIPELEKKIKAIETDGDLSTYEEKLAISDGTKDEMGDDTTAIVSFNSKDQLEKIHDKIAIKNNTAIVLTRSMKRVLAIKKEELELIMQAKRMELATVMENLNQMVKVFERQMKRVNRLIITLELYLGVKENVIQIQEGEPAPMDTVIALRQQMLYMDEEFGDPADGGLEHSSMKKFEDWMIKTKAYEKIAPEKKCVVVMRPRRKAKERSREMNPILKGQLEDLDRMIYIFIRNGDNIYRIWTDNLEFTDRLFPKKAELQEMVTEMMEAEHERNELEPDSYDYRNADERMNKAEYSIFYYKRTMILLQGIIQRTEIFTPLPVEFNLLDVNTHDGVVNYIYDDENLLPDGRVRFYDWLKDINKHITKGSRIIFGDAGFGADNEPSRFNLYWEHKESAPSMPPTDEYVVKEAKKEMWDYEVKRIPEEEYKKHNANVPIGERAYEKSSNSTYYVDKFDVNIPDKDRKREVEIYVLDDNGQRKKKYWIDEQLRISYNPGDTVWGGWGRTSHERKTNLTFRIYTSDTFILNYDACSLEDIEFYTNNRIDRVNYLGMMPLLWTLKAKLKVEKEWEDGFIRSLGNELSSQLNITDIDMIHDEIMKAINWWKNDVVKVWKRPLSKDDLKAHRMVKDKVISVLKKSLGVNITTANNKRAMVFTYIPNKGARAGNAWKYVVFGVFKHEFVDMIVEHSELTFWRDWDDRTLSKARIKREIAILESGDLMERAKEEEGKLVIISQKLNNQ